LAATIGRLLDNVPPLALDGPVLALVAPHAGYVYSGPVAAYAYAALRGRTFQRVVVVAPSHYESFSYASIYDGDAYATPLGNLAVDHAFARRLEQASSSIRISSHGHAVTAQGGEHAIEVQLPWLQQMLGDFQLVPIVMGDHSFEASRALGVALAALIADGQTLIVASSDLSHYHPYDDAVRMDHKTMEALAGWDYFSMARNFEGRVWEACGGAPIVATMIAAERLGANRAEVLRYANSGDTAGSHAKVVGYGAAAFLKSSCGDEEEKKFSLSDADKADLLALARASVECAVREKQSYEPSATVNAALEQERGAFVTLHKRGQLRGCIGFTSARKPLYLTVRDTALLAALRDPRFTPVAEPELPELDYEISVLSPLRKVLDVEQIEVGVHGLLIKHGSREGLLLPQVPVEQQWDRATFLAHTCHKAGLDPAAWKDDTTDIFSFTAVVFGEAKY
jgi:hypothetical protein